MGKLLLDKVVIRFAGDSGDGIQLIGNQFSDSSVIKSGNDVYTLVEYPSEIRAPAGSISGISGFQVTISSKKIFSFDNEVDSLVVFNPAALKISLNMLKLGGILFVDSDSFNDKNFKKAGYVSNPLTDESISNFKLVSIPITTLTYACVKDIINVVSKAKKCKNFFALGVICWVYDRSLDGIIDWLKKKFGDSDLFFANEKVLRAGYNYCSTIELFNNQFFIPALKLYGKDDKLVKISGNKAFAIGAITSSFLLKLPLFSANYPITPASDIFHELANYIDESIRVFQLEDEISAICSVIGASYGGSLAFTCTSGPGLDLMQEGLGLAIMANLPLILIDVQRCGPSTGIPTKSEQTDLLASIFGRHGESSVVVLAPNSPSDCFWTIIEASYLSIISLSPVIILSDANLANSSELWKVPCLLEIKKWSLVDFDNFYKSFNWNVPGKEGDVICIGGLERDVITGNVSHDPINHSLMVEKRHKKILNLVNYIEDVSVIGNLGGKVLIITWGSVFGLVRSLYDEMNKVFSLVCLRHLNPFPKNLKSIIDSFEKIVVIEENCGQLSFILRANYIIQIININQVTGKPFDRIFLKNKIFDIL
ncbi:2-oxoacid:acceptor oxidoreductase subunit alpha [Candidatus Azoamicus ciliaticola]|uniref:2-oxoglutarate oxidoreductase subunit KorA n=1 Tax=Candidatus Azoamicus ciliaticola TaxID=2652803 RepID=A0A6J5JX41_9GAMM|nr:2-oxoacid:acceptor oxidoreductase subunit alpha [Candidatus Azoamicus ciliaticola]CAB3976495.1 2-oxoglutarate oxidoreductase subunit KorA [Candidatus Azoamicus ciliaticola]